MRILMVSTDRTICKAGSAARVRAQKYAALVGNIDVVVFSLKKHKLQKSVEPNLTIIPTNSLSRLMYVLDAQRVANTLPKPDVVTAQDPFEAGLAGQALAARADVPLHVQVHTNFLASSFAMHHFPLNLVRLAIAPYVLSHATRVRTVSNSIREALIKKYSLTSPVSVLPIFIDIEKFTHTTIPAALAEKFAPFSKKVLVVSRLESEKNIDLALHAFAEASSAGECLIIVGEGSQRAELEKHVGEHDELVQKVFFEGWQDPAPYYKLADVVLFPSSSYDGYGMVIAEALASGTPVISTNVGIAAEAGAIVAEPEEFAQTLSHVLMSSKEEAVLKKYPYASENEYVQKWVDDVILAKS